MVATKQKPKSDTPPTSAEAWLWECRRENLLQSDVAGYLVTEPGNPQQMIAFVPYDDERAREKIDAEREIDGRHQSIANEVFRTPSALPDITGMAIDLRDVGRLDSMREVPAWLYGLLIRPLVECKYAGRRRACFFPFCPVRFARMVEHFIMLRWPDADRVKYPENTAGIGNDESGDFLHEFIPRVADFAVASGLASA